MNILNALKNATIKEYKKNQIIFQENEICTKIGYVLSGEVKISTISSFNQEETISYINTNEFFGNVLIFSDNPKYFGDVIAVKKSTILLINKDELIDLLQNNKTFLEFYLNEICNKTINIKKQNKLFVHKKINDRILYYFNQLKKQENSTQIKIPSITKLSLILSLPRPSVSRALKNLELDGFIKRNKNTIILLKEY